jgi:hypothetical protein
MLVPPVNHWATPTLARGQSRAVRRARVRGHRLARLPARASVARSARPPRPAAGPVSVWASDKRRGSSLTRRCWCSHARPRARVLSAIVGCETGWPERGSAARGEKSSGPSPSRSKSSRRPRGGLQADWGAAADRAAKRTVASASSAARSCQVFPAIGCDENHMQENPTLFNRATSGRCRAAFDLTRRHSDGVWLLDIDLC